MWLQEQLQVQMQNNLLANRLAEAKMAQAERALQASQLEKQFHEGQETMRKREDLTVRERMNSADNDTAMTITAAEIESGEKVAVSTGTGINP